jgi:geranylgeranyl transferase type-1 subunit beta
LNEDETVRWLAQRQIGGFQGRPGKLEDVCYSFWIGGALSVRPPYDPFFSVGIITSIEPSTEIQILGHNDLINEPPNRSFLLSAQSPMGGFGKEPEEYPDPFHSYLALAALTIMDCGREFGLGKLDVQWNISEGAAGWLRKETERVDSK